MSETTTLEIWAKDALLFIRGKAEWGEASAVNLFAKARDVGLENAPCLCETAKCVDDMIPRFLEQLGEPVVYHHQPGVSYEGLHTYRCQFCGMIWKHRKQWDGGTGSDNYWYREEAKR